jgi:hypothetical protein
LGRTEGHQRTGLWIDDVPNTLVYLFADYVYFENSSSNPYLIRRIEELNKVALPSGLGIGWRV